MELSGEFVNTQVDNENDNLENFQEVENSGEIIVENMKYKNSLGGEDIVHLKGNHIPRGLIPLENFLTKMMSLRIRR